MHGRHPVGTGREDSKNERPRQLGRDALPASCSAASPAADSSAGCARAAARQSDRRVRVGSPRSVPASQRSVRCRARRGGQRRAGASLVPRTRRPRSHPIRARLPSQPMRRTDPCAPVGRQLPSPQGETRRARPLSQGSSADRRDRSRCRVSLTERSDGRRGCPDPFRRIRVRTDEQTTSSSHLATHRRN